MIKNYISVALLAFICAMSISRLSAQERTEKYKVVVVEKSVDENGNTVEKKVVKEGEEAKKYIDSLENGEEHTWVSDEEETIKLKGDNKILKKESYKVISIDEYGNKKEVEWDGQGDMPSEIEEALKKEGRENIRDRSKDNVTSKANDVEDIEVEVKADGSGKEKKVIKITTNKDGKTEVIELELEGDEIPEDVQKTLDEYGIELNMRKGKTESEKIIVVEKEKSGNSNKAQLGVMIEATKDGVLVTEIVEGSSADNAGLLAGDIIMSIDKKEMRTTKALIDAIGSLSAGDVIVVDFMRNGKAQTKEIALQKRKELFEYKTWDEVMEKDDSKN